jgi:RNA polymerase sigma-70 factor (ECF subfamily)
MVPVIHMNDTGPLSDAALLQQFRTTGSQEVLAALYLRYTDLVYGTAMKYLKDAEAAKDAVMNIYQELVYKLPSQEIDTFKSWLYVVVKNHCLMQLRRQKKQVTVEFQPSFVQSEDFNHLDNVLDKEKELEKLEKCMEGLPDEQEKAIRLFYLEGKCYHEIKEITALDWNKVRSLIQNGRRNLKNCMDKP